MLIVFEFTLIAIVLVMVVSQIILPIFSDKPFFWLFRGEQTPPPVEEEPGVWEKIEEVKEDKAELTTRVETLRTYADEKLKVAEFLKKETDEL